MSSRLLLIEAGGSPEVPSLAPLIRSQGFQVEQATWESLSVPRLQTSHAHLIVPVAIPPSEQPIAFLDLLRRTPLPIPTFAVLPGEPTDELLLAAMGVIDDLILWPVREPEFRLRAHQLLGLGRPPGHSVEMQLMTEIGISQLVGVDAVFVQAIEKIPVMARSDTPVLITGETGTGKELCARAIHHLGKRRPFPFIPVDCSTLPENLLENELFGHARGAFTDAHCEQRGLVAMADHGTLFLDEIDALSLTAQGKLMRFLQERVYRPLGADRFMHADVNVVAATNRDLAALVQERHFRSDLYFRLNVLRLDLPPLRARPADIPLLARHFLETPDQSCGPHKVLSPAAERKLCLYSWPGNVRELANTLRRTVLFCEGVRILPHHILLPDSAGVAESKGTFRAARAQAIEYFERAYVRDLLRRHGSNITRAAAEAGKERRALGRLVKKYNLKAPLG